MNNSMKIKLKAVMKMARYYYARNAKKNLIVGKSLNFTWSTSLKKAWSQVKKQGVTLNKLFKVSISDFVLVWKKPQTGSKFLTALKDSLNVTNYINNHLSEYQKDNTLVRCLKSGTTYDAKLFVEIFR